MATKTKRTTKPETNGKHDAPVDDLLVTALTRAQVGEAANFDRSQALSLVGLYYSIQKLRVGQSNRVWAHDNLVDTSGDPKLLNDLKEELFKVEKQAARALAKYAEGQQLGRWAMSNIGVGPVITAGLLAHIDFHHCCCPVYRNMDKDSVPTHKCPGLATPGSIWRFAGLDPSIKWEKGQKRPYNAHLKTICWRLGESFKKTSNHAEGFYGRLYRERKVREVQYNNEGRFKEQALERLAKAKKMGYSISPEQREIWSGGKLQDKGLDLRAMRYAVTIFLSHYHYVGRMLLFGEVCVPWVMKDDGHAHFIPAPNWPMTKE